MTDTDIRRHVAPQPDDVRHTLTVRDVEKLLADAGVQRSHRHVLRLCQSGTCKVGAALCRQGLLSGIRCGPATALEPNKAVLIELRDRFHQLVGQKVTVPGPIKNGDQRLALSPTQGSPRQTVRVQQQVDNGVMSELVLADIRLLQLLATRSLHHFEIGPPLRRRLGRLWCHNLIGLKVGNRWHIKDNGRRLIEEQVTLH